MSASIHTLGCRVNQYESHLLAERLLGAEAEVHVVNTCTVTSLADRKSRQLIARLRREHPAALIVATGCGADGAGPGLRTAGADLLVGNRDKARIADVIQRFLLGEPPPEMGSWEGLDGERLIGPERRVRALLKVQDGCTVGCTFCRTWQVRGPLRSKTPAAARAEAEILARGHREIVLVGVNLAQYGEDLPARPALADLLRTLLGVPEVRFRLSSLNPDGLTAELIALFAGERRLCPYLHLPLQSGDDALLARMGRPYTAAEYAERARTFLRSVPQATLGADVLIGFPEEDEAAFDRTVAILAELVPLNVHAFRYSARPGTAAERFGPRVSTADASSRAARLADLAHGWARSSQERFLGAEVRVAVEDVADGVAWGRSENYLWVGVRGEEAARGTIVPARLVALADGHLVGVRTDRAQSS